MVNELKKRHEQVLELIIKIYIETADPVSSRIIAKRLNLSSATIRNVMADLEETGFITQPHTSAGRIPTDRGYRYYIDSLMRLQRINHQVINFIGNEYHHAIRSLDGVLEKTSRLISSLTNYVGIALYPQYERMYMNGTSHIIEQPEFKDIKKLYSLLKCLEERKEILDLLRNDFNEEKLIIHIGKENKFSDLSDCAIVTRGYKAKGKLLGRLGVIGPRRMVYEKVIPTIEVMADTLTEILDSVEV